VGLDGGFGGLICLVDCACWTNLIGKGKNTDSSNVPRDLKSYIIS